MTTNQTIVRIGGGVKSSLIDINPYNISNIDLEKTKSFYREEVMYS